MPRYVHNLFLNLIVAVPIYFTLRLDDPMLRRTSHTHKNMLVQITFIIRVSLKLRKFSPAFLFMIYCNQFTISPGFVSDLKNNLFLLLKFEGRICRCVDGKKMISVAE